MRILKVIGLLVALTMIGTVGGQSGPVIVRGPYVQMAVPDGITVRWRTDVPADTRVRYGLDPADLSFLAEDLLTTTEHEVRLESLLPNTRYYYAIGTTSGDLAGGDPEHYFVTSPVAGSQQASRIWVLGDFGSADIHSDAVRDAYYNFNTDRPTDLVLLLGDNAYGEGTDAQHQAALFDTLPTLIRNASMWPNFGNHDVNSSHSSTQTGPYFDSFNMPANGESGGVASGTEAYYSFDFGNVHFIAMNSEDVNRTPGAPMLAWLEQDLAASTADWVVAYWHHPPYSKGAHDSDLEIRMVQMRENVLPILEGYGVDLVLTGHSHAYERSYLIDGHYGLSGTFMETMKVDGGDGTLGGTGAYQKSGKGLNPHEGTVYVVAGSASRLGSGAFDHPAVYLSIYIRGSLVLDPDGDRMEAIFLDDAGLVRDRFMIVKNTAVAPVAGFSATPVRGAAPLTVRFQDLSSTNTASWAWDLDGDAQDDSIEREPEFVYDLPGLYDVTLAVANDSGSDLVSRPLYVCVSTGFPAETTGLTVGADHASLNWSAVPAAEQYDVVRGDLVTLRSTGGDFSAAVIGCVESGSLDTSSSDGTVPSPGNGFFYLVRGISSCGEAGTYDETGNSQAGGRDGEIDGAANSCP
ncbi:MAG: metallophosphoesterase [Acidobacteria bacterium]|uniref:Metallophosphoesterase n=1 Tax=Candidatus Polarisedimenticola svalbardensis TaxID=2886004 RepID=A0A8J6Y882_9BACT|nr:metallophosphoesterase [Candidatus Polarisedimenticola svalbardensis]